MSNKKYIDKLNECLSPPTDLSSSVFYGIKLDDEQRVYRDAIYDKNNLIVFAEAPAGTGKTTISVATAVLMCDYGMYEGVVYVSASTQQDEIGFLPGGYDEKILAYISPLYQALTEIREKTHVVIDTVVPSSLKEGNKYIVAMTPNFLRGQNIKNAVVIIDEAQNMTTQQLKTIITRCDDNCKVICIGSLRQIDLQDVTQSGFATCIEHFSEKSWAKICKLQNNHRGKLSSWADRL